jgi:4-hydroxyphenylpyruvate dioxygenase-like putative hemolysin
VEEYFQNQYRHNPSNDILNDLEKKAKLVDWRKGERKEYFVLFSRTGFTANLEKLAGERGDLLLWK